MVKIQVIEILKKVPNIVYSSLNKKKLVIFKGLTYWYNGRSINLQSGFISTYPTYIYYSWAKIQQKRDKI